LWRISCGCCKESGIQHVILCVGHLGEMIEQAVGDGSAFGVKVEYSYDGPTLLGTGEPFGSSFTKLGESFFVLYGDSYLACDYAAIEHEFLRRGKLGLMTVFRNDGQWDASNVEFEAGHILAYSKKNRTSSHALHRLRAGVFRADAFAEHEARTWPTFMQELLEAARIGRRRSARAFYEIGSPRD
jgi:NDP-sugar pyrophosphorylase family protein